MPKKSKTKITWMILFANIIVFIFSFIPSVFKFLALTPTEAIIGKYWQFFTYMYVHGSLEHILLNMFALVVFGPRIESELGKVKFFLFYTIAGIFSALFHILLSGISPIPLIGASGAIFAILTAFGLFYPKDIIYVNLLIPVPAFIYVIIIGVLQFIYAVSGAQPGISNFGHLGGMIAAIIMIKFFGFNKKRIKYWYE